MIYFFKSYTLFSVSKREVLNQKLKISNITEHITKINYLYFIEAKTLTKHSKTTLEKLLNAHFFKTLTSKNTLIITPRFGTVSPWSSKAMDILHLCGFNKKSNTNLGQVKRAECATLYEFNKALSLKKKQIIAGHLLDKMTENYILSLKEVNQLFTHLKPKYLAYIDILNLGKIALTYANKKMGLALQADEINYLFLHFKKLNRNPTDVELMSFAQTNSEHCRHKIFNASWTIDNQNKRYSLFDLIKKTYMKRKTGLLSVYKDNAAVANAFISHAFFPNKNGSYMVTKEHKAILMKVETHNHPTAIAPFSGAATGAGGEIRDEGATGRGSIPKVGLCGFSVSNLHLPEYQNPWEHEVNKPSHIASALDIMIEAPIGAARYNNEFGRPNICGYFRSFEMKISNLKNKKYFETRGYHKPIMLAGGLGHIRKTHIKKNTIPDNALIIVLGGPAMPIGLGGGASSSTESGMQNEKLDFASVQRANAEMQRRAQEVINHCTYLGIQNPIISIHDVGAGGLSNAIPELVYESKKGALLDIRSIPSDDAQMSPMEIWCNEAQERYVLVIDKKNLKKFNAICQRERTPFAVLGKAIKKKQLLLNDILFKNKVIDIPMSVLLGKLAKKHRNTKRTHLVVSHFNTQHIELKEAVKRILSLPSVASKHFLITISDRSVGGLVARDQMVGGYQVGVADCAISLADYEHFHGEAMAIGEKSPLTLYAPEAAARMTIGEALTNLLGVYIEYLTDINLSANWMCAANHKDEDAKLYAAVKAASTLCTQLGLVIPVGKDSLSMKTTWQNKLGKQTVIAPLSLVISAFSKVRDVRLQKTPVLNLDVSSRLYLIDLGQGKMRLGASALSQVFNSTQGVIPDMDDVACFISFFNLINDLNKNELILSYHDRSDGGVFVTLCEMAFATRVGLDIKINSDDLIAHLFNEELGCIVQIADCNLEAVKEKLTQANIAHITQEIACINKNDTINIYHNGQKKFAETRIVLEKLWSYTSYQIAKMRDNPVCAQAELDNIANVKKALPIVSDFETGEKMLASYSKKMSAHKKINKHYVKRNIRPKVAILREQGINGHIEMAAAFYRARFDAIDVHMSDLLNGLVDLKDFKGVVACGGFSYGDVLGAGRGWANTILLHEKTKIMFQTFFNRDDSFTLGVCNGCQMLTYLREIIPGSSHFPSFNPNLSQQFEARFSAVKILKSPSIFFHDMGDALLPITIAHCEGRTEFKQTYMPKYNTLCYVDNTGKITKRYPFNPNGSAHGVAGVTSENGQVSIMMPHPERVYRSVQNSYHPKHWRELSPWFRMFVNARLWID